MNYGPAAVAGMKQHDNVFVRPEVQDRFLQTGVWPEGTMFVLELRSPESEGSINHGGQFQTDLTGLEAEVKDSARFDGGWGYFEFDTDPTGPTGPAAVLPPTAACYRCHRTNGAVENTFTQFYPTLFPVAVAKGTVRADFAGMPATSAQLVAAATTGGWAAAERLLANTKARWPDAAVAHEASLNLIAYRIAQAGKPAESPPSSTSPASSPARPTPGTACPRPTRAPRARRTRGGPPPRGSGGWPPTPSRARGGRPSNAACASDRRGWPCDGSRHDAAHPRQAPEGVRGTYPAP
jgi:hypothetical protein